MSFCVPPREPGNCQATLYNVAEHCGRKAAPGSAVCKRCADSVRNAMNQSLPLKLLIELAGLD